MQPHPGTPRSVDNNRPPVPTSSSATIPRRGRLRRSTARLLPDSRTPSRAHRCTNLSNQTGRRTQRVGRKRLASNEAVGLGLAGLAGLSGCWLPDTSWPSLAFFQPATHACSLARKISCPIQKRNVNDQDSSNLPTCRRRGAVVRRREKGGDDAWRRRRGGGVGIRGCRDEEAAQCSTCSVRCGKV